MTGSSSEVIFAVVEQKSDEHIGNVKLGPINWVHRRAMFGIMIGDKRFWGRGVGEEVTRLMVEYGFNRLNLHRIGLVVFEEHESAVRCYRKKLRLRSKAGCASRCFRTGSTKRIYGWDFCDRTISLRRERRPSDGPSPSRGPE